jgi:hypothetical protein
MSKAQPTDWNRDDCTSWCTDTPHNADPACWGKEDGSQQILLSMESGFPREAVEPYDPIWIRKEQDPPHVGVYAYRQQPGYRDVVYLHLYRPSHNDHLDLDCSVHMTSQEAVELAARLLSVAVIIDPDLADEIEGAK